MSTMPTPVSECLYCQKNETLDLLMIKICDLEVSQLFLFKEQSYFGRCNVVFKDHAVEFHELSDEQRNAFMKDVAKAGKAVASALNPSKTTMDPMQIKYLTCICTLCPNTKTAMDLAGFLK